MLTFVASSAKSHQHLSTLLAVCLFKLIRTTHKRSVKFWGCKCWFEWLHLGEIEPQSSGGSLDQQWQKSLQTAHKQAEQLVFEKEFKKVPKQLAAFIREGCSVSLLLTVFKIYLRHALSSVIAWWKLLIFFYLISLPQSFVAKKNPCYLREVVAEGCLANKHVGKLSFDWQSN